ncbi:unnamed protein product [Rhizophagus irregularis]|nr:unnamed protein product [Rhizophagus irregularis]
MVQVFLSAWNNFCSYKFQYSKTSQNKEQLSGQNELREWLPDQENGSPGEMKTRFRTTELQLLDDRISNEKKAKNDFCASILKIKEARNKFWTSILYTYYII